ncbi:pentatricopeptide repeat-containing protein At2g33680 [Cryptomeria japonica]|uniref:pentatricopeptide repeat-containing protein At2g33680 n=1 Tax=Cryptomeria japonica TaxID=3369 RepID=UPI0027DA321B|nr:pentatricopeptide repeat-containing protein At2g33680 [Cryptomeria japonica]XP_057834596.2 pentatricopeptide repeat-containing protein At2g33680 [Cryptomeria japonica]XP_057834597.2 pentatricopeptide repeat-containing protein At2g33680 [Cryptomeria japonica]XP_059074172.1 pentatricopeptide repeat-containing protein At2g33680 [Cryptomeria japonica]
MKKPPCTVYRFVTSRLRLLTNNLDGICVGYSRAAATACAFAIETEYTTEHGGVCIDAHTYVRLLNNCISKKNVSGGNTIHAQIIKNGLQNHAYLLTNIVNMYAKCGRLFDARQAFDEMPEKTVVSWNAMISGYTQQGYGKKALDLFSQMQKADMKPSEFSFGSVLRSCASVQAQEQGNQVHAQALKLGFSSDTFVAGALVDMYAKCGNIEDARQMFDTMAVRDVVSWNALIAGYAQNGHVQEALEVYRDMQKSNVKLTQFAISSVLQACAGVAALEQGKQVHAQAVKTGLELEMFVASALVDMYPKCDSIKDALKVFETMPERDVVSWTAMIVGCAQNGCSAESLKLFCQMREARVKPNQFPIASVLSGCANLEAQEQGKQIHSYIIKTGFNSDIFVGNALVDMYAKCKSIGDARKLFEGMLEQDIVSWNAIIAGYAQNDHGEEALKLLHKMQWINLKPDIYTFGSVLRACASLAALERGQKVHTLVIKSNITPEPVVGCALVDMYAKCGSLEIARKVFNIYPKEDVVPWNAMIAAYAQHGCGNEAIQIFEEMQPLGIKPNEITFVSVLFACSHIGSVVKGRNFFKSMTEDHGITPEIEHYVCMVDLLGRSGHLDEAEAFINSIPFKPNALLWKTLLGACNVHCNVDIGIRAAGFALRLEPDDHATYVSLSNLYAAANRWENVANVRKMMRERKVKKEPGCSWVEVKNSVHTFIKGDRSHPKTAEIYSLLHALHVEMKKRGYVPDTRCVLTFA